jgi:hypothetical protein
MIDGMNVKISINWPYTLLAKSQDRNMKGLS